MTTFVQGSIGRDALATALAATATIGGLYGREETEFAEGISTLEFWSNPANAFLDQAGTGRTNTRDLHWFDDEIMQYTDTLYGATDYNTSATAVYVTNPKLFKVNDLIRNESNEVFLVTAVNNTTRALTVVRDYGQSVEGWTAKAAAMTHGDVVSIIGSTARAGQPTPTAVKTLEVEYVNYSQTFRESVNVTEDVMESALRGEAGEYDREKRKKMTEFLMRLENTAFWGKPYKGDRTTNTSLTSPDPTGADTAGGLNHYLEYYSSSDYLKDETDLTEFEFLDWLEAAFDKGSDTKVMFCPKSLRTGFAKWGLIKEVSQAGSHASGHFVTEWIAPTGQRLFIVTHDGLKAKSAPSTSYNYVFIVDFQNFKKVYYGPNGPTRYRDLNKFGATGETVVAGEYHAKMTYMVRLPKTHFRGRYQTISAS